VISEVMTEVLVYALVVSALVREKANSIAGGQGFLRFQSLQGLFPADGGNPRKRTSCVRHRGSRRVCAPGLACSRNVGSPDIRLIGHNGGIAKIRCDDRRRHQEWLKFLRVINDVTPPGKQFRLIG